MMTDEKTSAKDIGTEKADPVSAEGAGDGAISSNCAETLTTEKTATMRNTAIAFLACAIFLGLSRNVLGLKRRMEKLMRTENYGGVYL